MASPHGSADYNPFASPDPPPASSLMLLNIRNHVPVVLSADEGNFRQWLSFFELIVQKLGIANHIDGTVDAAAMFDDPEWL